MESTLTGSAETYKPDVYPCLKKMTNGRDFIVLFHAPQKGVVVWSTEGDCFGYEVGEYCEKWSEELFDLVSPDTVVNLHN